MRAMILLTPKDTWVDKAELWFVPEGEVELAVLEALAVREAEL